MGTRINFEPSLDAIQTTQARESTIPRVTERQFATLRWRDSYELNGRMWRTAESGFGLFAVPAVLATTIHAAEFGFPRWNCLGIRARVAGCDAEANGCERIHLLTDAAQLGPDRLSKKAANSIRKALTRPELRVDRITSDNLQEFLRQGPSLMASHLRHNPYAVIPSTEGFREGVMKSGLMEGQIAVMAGFVDGVLAAYVTGVAVDNKVIIEAMVIREELKSSNIGSLTLYAFMQACRRTQGVTEIVNSREFASDPGLTRYKESMGFAVQLIPVTVKVRPIFELGLKTLVRYRRPQLYFELYGHY